MKVSLIVPNFSLQSVVATERMSLRRAEEMSDESDDNVMTSAPKPSSSHQVLCCYYLC